MALPCKDMELTDSPFSLSHCKFDEDQYAALWHAKTTQHLQMLARETEVASDVLERCTHISSLPRNFRARTRFSIQQYPDGGADYYCVDEGQRVLVKSYPIAARQINHTMPHLLRHLHPQDGAACASVTGLAHGLQVVSFLSTSTGELLIGLVYDRPIAVGEDDAWCTQAAALRDLLLADAIPEVTTLSIIGRSRKLMLCVGQAFVMERLALSDGRVLLYKQPEGAFSNPNTQVSRKALDWLSATFKAITMESPGGVKKNLLEMYCGNGNHTVALAPLVANVVAVELSEALCAAARENLQLNGITNGFIINTHAHKFSHKVLRAKKWVDPASQAEICFDMVLVDPPRAGLDAKTLALVASYEYIVYISCCPEALARDVKHLQEKAHFTVDKMATFDQFAYASHLEIGVFLKKQV